MFSSCVIYPKSEFNLEKSASTRYCRRIRNEKFSDFPPFFRAHGGGKILQFRRVEEILPVDATRLIEVGMNSVVTGVAIFHQL